MIFTPVAKMFSSVGGGPLQRVVETLRSRGEAASLHPSWSPESWRAAFSRGKLGRWGTRLAALAGYPLKVVGEGVKASFRFGAPLEKPILVVTTNPFVLPYVAVLTRPLHRCGVVVLMYDMYPDALEAAGVVNPWLSRVLTVANRLTIARADAVVYLGDVMRRSAEARYGTNAKTYTIANGALMSEFAVGHDALDSDLKAWMGERCIFSYVGNMGLMHDVETLRQALPGFIDSLSASERAGVGFVFAASGGGVEALKAAWGDKFADVVRFIGPQPDAPWSDLLRRTDVALATLTERAHATCAPSKVYSALAAGCALIAVGPKDSDLAQLIEDRVTGFHSEKPIPCGVVVVPGDVQGLVGAFRSFLKPKGISAHAEGVALAARRYDITGMAGLWQKCLKDVAQDACLPWGTALYRGIKRSLDVKAAAFGLAVLWPVMAATALCVRCKLGAPVTFRQQRPGLDGKPFELIKFRSMRVASGIIDAARDAERLTAFGKKIRALSLDELPTLWNVLRGDMSLVGPRPLLMAYLDRYSAHQARRQWVKPGITGWAQVNGRNALSWSEKFDLDVWYVEHASPLLDIKILLKTIETVLTRRGVSHAASATMPEFMGDDEVSNT